MNLKTLPALAPPSTPSGPSDISGAFEDDELRELAERIAKLSNQDRLALAEKIKDDLT